MVGPIMKFALCEQQHFLIAKTTVNTTNRKEEETKKKKIARTFWDGKTEQGKEILMIIFMHVIAAKKSTKLIAF